MKRFKGTPYEVAQEIDLWGFTKGVQEISVEVTILKGDGDVLLAPLKRLNDFEAKKEKYVESVYPCKNCKGGIDPFGGFCFHCGGTGKNRI